MCLIDTQNNLMQGVVLSLGYLQSHVPNKAWFLKEIFSNPNPTTSFGLQTKS